MNWAEELYNAQEVALMSVVKEYCEECKEQEERKECAEPAQ